MKSLKLLEKDIRDLIERFKDSEELINFYNGERIIKVEVPRLYSSVVMFSNAFHSINLDLTMKS